MAAGLIMEEVSIAICDDEQRWRKDIIELCSSFATEYNYKFVFTEYESGKELLNTGINNVDILFLDVEMQDINGIEVKNRLQTLHSDVHIIFITSHNEIIEDAFGRNVYGFITKPIDKVVFNRRINLIIDSMLEERKTIMLNNYGRIKLIYLKDVVYIEADARYSRIYTVDSESYDFSDKSIGFWKEYLEANGFQMSMRSILVNLAYVDRVGQTEVFMKNGCSLDLSRRSRKQFGEAFRDYIWKKGC